MSKHPFVLSVLLLGVGCAEILGGVAQGVGQELGRQMVAGSQPPPAAPAASAEPTASGGRTYDPSMYGAYLAPLFSIAFSGGGYAVSTAPFKPGEWVKFSMEANEDSRGGWFERAFLGDDASGNHWWRVKFFDGGENSTIVMEGLFTADMQRVLRMRAQFPDDKGPQEIPVDQSTYYYPPRTLTKESLAGASQGTESVTTKAGTFTANHVRFGGASGGQDWWLVEAVPGGVVKQRAGNAERAHVILLEAFGSGAKSELGSF